MILNFEDYKNSLEDDNDYLFEAMSISTEVSEETSRVVDFIQTHNGDDGDIDIFGCNCEIYINFHNFSNENDLPSKPGNMQMGTKLDTSGDISKVSFILDGDVIALNGKITDMSVGVISHELRHAYVSYKIYNGVPKTTAKERRDMSRKWLGIYNSSIAYLKNYNKNYPLSEFFDGTDFYKILFVIYRSDVSEIAAFTQQAYEYCKKCKTISEVKTKMKDTDLYKVKVSFKNISELITNEDIQRVYEIKKREYGLDELPEISKLMNYFNKRYKKVCSNYGKVVAFIYDELKEDKGELIEVR